MTSTRRSLFGWLVLALVPLALGACATAPDRHGMTREQVAVLQQQGFVDTGDGWLLSFTDELLFDVDSSAIRPETAQRIRRMSDALLQVGIRSARVEGHTDATGTHAYNLTLSQSRAATVAAVMTAQGFAPGALAIHGRGEAFPVADNGTETGRAQNRRVSIIVSAL